MDEFVISRPVDCSIIKHRSGKELLGQEYMTVELNSCRTGRFMTVTSEKEDIKIIISLDDLANDLKKVIKK